MAVSETVAAVCNAVLYTAPASGGTLAEGTLLRVRIAKERGVVVFKVENETEESLLRKVCTKFRVKLQLLVDYDGFVTSVGDSVDGAIDSVRRNIEAFFHVSVRMSSFPPPTVPLAIAGQEIVLNLKNAFLRQLGGLESEPEELRPIYASLLDVFKTVGRITPETGFDPLAIVITQLLGRWCEASKRSGEDRRKLRALTDRWWMGPAPLIGLSPGFSFSHHGQKYTRRCFLIRPFSDGYRDVHNVVVATCAEFGILAEAADAPETEEILKKVCRHIDSCDFAIADISENNPNVLFELGVVMARRKPSIILSSTDRRDASGTRIPTDIIGIERIDYKNVTEDLREKLRRILKTLGGS